MSANPPLAIAPRHSRRAWWFRLAGLFVAGFIVLVPVARAFCAIDLPVGDAPISIGASGWGGGFAAQENGPCCEQSPAALAACAYTTDDLAPGSAGPLDLPLAQVASAPPPPFRAAARTVARLDVPPPAQPLFRRLKRLLI